MVDYLWFVEFQRRGAPHIHILTDFVGMQIDNLRLDLARYWAGLVEPEDWPYCPTSFIRLHNSFQSSNLRETTTQSAVVRVHVHKKMWEELRSKDGGARYVTKYATKTEQKLVPLGYANMGRYWGAPQHHSIKSLIRTWVYTDSEGAEHMVKVMDRDFDGWDRLPKIILGSTDKLLTMLQDSV